MMWPLAVFLMIAGWEPKAYSRGEPGRASGRGSATEDPDSVAGQEATLDLRVVDARDKTPLPDVSIVVFTANVASASTLATDQDGHCRIAVPKQATQFLGISVRKEGFVPVRVTWKGRDIATELPESYTLALKPGTLIGGTVRDTQGRPIAGALVYIWFEGEQPANEREQLFLADQYHVETDGKGRWRCKMMPDNLSVHDRLIFRLIHPNYVSEPMGNGRSLPIQALRGLTSVMVMEDGIPLTGRVVDSRGLPIAGAQVFLQAVGYDINRASLTPEQARCLQTETDADGRYRFGHIEPGERRLVVFVEARGYVRQTDHVVVGARSKPAEIRLRSDEEVAHLVLDFEQLLREEENAGPNHIPERWVMNGVLMVVTCASLIWLSWRWRARRRSQRCHQR